MLAPTLASLCTRSTMWAYGTSGGINALKVWRIYAELIHVWKTLFTQPCARALSPQSICCPTPDAAPSFPTDRLNELVQRLVVFSQISCQSLIRAKKRACVSLSNKCLLSAVYLFHASTISTVKHSPWAVGTKGLACGTNPATNPAKAPYCGRINGFIFNSAGCRRWANVLSNCVSGNCQSFRWARKRRARFNAPTEAGCATAPSR